MTAESRTQQKLLILGGTGLVGSQVVRLSAEHPSVGEITALARRIPVGTDAAQPDRVRWVAVDFDKLEDQGSLFAVDVVLCALGTTIGRAGSKEAFEAVDLQLPLRAARLARAAGATRFGAISSVNANPQSPFFYTRTKGRMEEGLAALGFNVLVLARPSLLLGDRAEKRFGEDLAKSLFSPIHSLIPSTWRPIEAVKVAGKLLESTLESPPGTHVLNNALLHQ